VPDVPYLPFLLAVAVRMRDISWIEDAANKSKFWLLQENSTELCLQEGFNNENNQGMR